MSLDETCLSNGDVYTMLTDKAAHGGKGALAGWFAAWPATQCRQY